MAWALSALLAERCVVERDRRDGEGVHTPKASPSAARLWLRITRSIDCGVGLVAVEGAELARHFGRGRIGDAGHDGGEGGADGAAFRAVIGNAGRHQEAADIGVAKAERAELVGIAARSPLTGTAPSSPRFRARWSTAARRAHRRRCRFRRCPRRRNCKRFSEARLHAVSSRNIYSEQGFEATIGPSAGQVCQSLIVV